MRVTGVSRWRFFASWRTLEPIQSHLLSSSADGCGQACRDARVCGAPIGLAFQRSKQWITIDHALIVARISINGYSIQSMGTNTETSASFIVE
jgi:hypothetical protein